jgi:hypothetical protein
MPAAIIHPRCFLADLNLMMLGQLLGGKRRTEIVPVRLRQDRHRLLLRFRRQLAVGGFPPQSMHYYRISLLLHPPQQLPHPSLGHAHSSGCFPLRHLPVPCSFQPNPASPVPVGSSRFVPLLSLAAVNRNFYLAQLGTAHLAATRAAPPDPLCVLDVI